MARSTESFVLAVQRVFSSFGGDEELLSGLLSDSGRLVSGLPSLPVPLLLIQGFWGQFAATRMGRGVLVRVDGDGDEAGLPLALHQGEEPLELLARLLLRDEEGGGVDEDAACQLSDSFSFLLGDSAREEILSSFGLTCFAKSKLSLISVLQFSNLDTSVLTFILLDIVRKLTSV